MAGVTVTAAREKRRAGRAWPKGDTRCAGGELSAAQLTAILGDADFRVVFDPPAPPPPVDPGDPVDPEPVAPAEPVKGKARKGKDE